jgi:hypothetical protein
MFKCKGEFNENKFVSIVSINGITDLSKAKMVRYTGGHPDSPTTTKESSAAATSAKPSPPSVSPEKGKESSGNRKSKGSIKKSLRLLYNRKTKTYYFGHVDNDGQKW